MNEALRAYLDTALDLNAVEQDVWLADLHRTDPAAAIAVRALLARERELDAIGFLNSPAPLLDGSPPSLEGQRIGAYTLLGPLGQGGMGGVWRARRSDGRYEAEVAIKLINLALLDRVGRERFRREGQTLARLEHPGIARLLDAGVTAAGVPYLVLEFVDGEHVDEYCRRHRLAPHARIKLILQVIAAVAHAHANLVVHRDLKPSNILVTATGTIKLLDFGIAKLLEPDTGVAERTDLTEQGGAMLTPEYAAPEQVTGGVITTATDIYAIGVLLYLLLTGRHPTRRADATTADRLRALIEGEPERLGAAVSTSTAGVSSRQLRRLYRGDLANIVARTLEKDPARRYASMTALADDLERYLRHEPVEARTPSLRYRVGKFVRRNRIAVGFAVLASVGLLSATVVTWSQMIEARTQRDNAQVQRDRAVYESRRSAASNGFMLSLLSGVHPEEQVSTLELLERAREILERDHGSDPRFVARMMLDLSDEFGPVIAPSTQKTLLTHAAERAARSGDPELAALAHCDLARFHASAYVSPDSARPHLDRGRRELRRTATPSPAVESRCLLAESRIRTRSEDGSGALALQTRALALAETGTDTASPAFAGLLIDAAALSLSLGRPRAALPLAQRAAQVLRSAGRAGTVQMVNALSAEAAAMEGVDPATSDSVFQEWRRLAAGMGERFVPAIENRLAHRYLAIGWPDSAVAHWTQKFEQLPRRDDAAAAIMLNWLARALIEAERFPEARARVVALRAHPAADPIDVAQVDGRLAEAEGRHAQALGHYRDLLTSLGFPDLRFAQSFWPYVARAARMALLAGNAAAADSLAERAFVYAERFQPEDQLARGRIRLVQARARAERADSAAAVRFALEGIRLLETRVGPRRLAGGEMEEARSFLRRLPKHLDVPLSSSASMSRLP